MAVDIVAAPVGELAPWRRRLATGCVLVAHPLALDAGRHLDERRQRALTRYYLDAGAGGVAVGVHTTQFAIREPQWSLLAPVLELTAHTVRDHARQVGTVLVAGACGDTRQAVAEAELAAGLGYHAVLLSQQGAYDLSDADLLRRAEAVGQVLPVIGFYSQEAIGGRRLPRSFWSALSDLPCVVAIKIAPFDRYRTHDVVTAVLGSDRRDDIALYTGNDDAIVTDLVTPYTHHVGGELVVKHVVGGLLGQWATWTRRAVELLERVHRVQHNQASDARQLGELLRIGGQLTQANAAVFDVANDFRGCIAGVHEVLRGQGLLAGRWCLDPNEELSPGQAAEIARVRAAYPWLTDDAFVAEHLDDWLR